MLTCVTLWLRTWRSHWPCLALCAGSVPRGAPHLPCTWGLGAALCHLLRTGSGRSGRLALAGWRGGRRGDVEDERPSARACPQPGAGRGGRLSPLLGRLWGLLRRHPSQTGDTGREGPRGALGVEQGGLGPSSRYILRLSQLVTHSQGLARCCHPQPPASSVPGLILALGIPGG